MKIKFFFSLPLLVFCFISSLYAQPYHAAAGIRVGSANGFSYKQFIGESTAVEALAVYRREGFRAIALFQQHLEVASNTYMFLGIGGHGGYTGLLGETQFSTPRPVWGVDAEFGFEYVFPYSPLSLGLSLKPMFELYKQRTFSGNNAGLSLRMNF